MTLPRGVRLVARIFRRLERRPIDIYVDVPRVNDEKLSGTRQGEPSAVVREQIAAARMVQTRRLKGTRLLTNADIGPAKVRTHCQLDGAGQRLMQAAMCQLHHSTHLPPRAHAGPHDRRPHRCARHRAGASG